MQLGNFIWARGEGAEWNMLRGVNGRIGVTRAAFLKTGGYDEKFAAWNADDWDFNSRLQFLGYQPVEMPTRFLESIPHSDYERFYEYPEAYQQEVWKHVPYDTCRTTGIANYGNFGCGWVSECHDHYFDRGFRLWPLPTRIFGIGLNKTATTSLHVALQRLGFESAHWESTQWAAAIWQEMLTDGHSPTLENVLRPL